MDAEAEVCLIKCVKPGGWLEVCTGFGAHLHYTTAVIIFAVHAYFLQMRGANNYGAIVVRQLSENCLHHCSCTRVYTANHP